MPGFPREGESIRDWIMADPRLKTDADRAKAAAWYDSLPKKSGRHKAKTTVAKIQGAARRRFELSNFDMARSEFVLTEKLTAKQFETAIATKINGDINEAYQEIVRAEYLARNFSHDS